MFPVSTLAVSEALRPSPTLISLLAFVRGMDPAKRRNLFLWHAFVPVMNLMNIKIQTRGGSVGRVEGGREAHFDHATQLTLYSVICDP